MRPVLQISHGMHPPVEECPVYLHQGILTRPLDYFQKYTIDLFKIRRVVHSLDKEKK